MEKLDWMLGMTENMMNIADRNRPASDQMYAMTSTMMGNLHHMKMMDPVEGTQMDMMESMMRSMEDMMKNMRMDDQMQQSMMHSMMRYMIMMQMNMIMQRLNCQ
ncbi:MAG: hypothetical protein ACOCWQ_01945 [Nanoarchaeota archaeon]